MLVLSCFAGIPNLFLLKQDGSGRIMTCIQYLMDTAAKESAICPMVSDASFRVMFLTRVHAQYSSIHVVLFPTINLTNQTVTTCTSHGSS
jgi:hypothetical protein